MRSVLVTLPALAFALALAACSRALAPQIPEVTRPDPAPGTAADEGKLLQPAVVKESWLSQMIEADNIDSPAVWMSPEGSPRVIATAKAVDQLVIYDGDSGATLQRFGTRGSAPGQFMRPNGVFTVGDLLLVVERDGRRVQLLQLPDFAPLLSFGENELIKPYGLWARQDEKGLDVYVTDSYELVEDQVPPLHELDRRVRRYRVEASDSGYVASLTGTFGDTSEAGALRVVETIWGDAHHDRLLIAEEDESWANEIKIYDLEGRFTGSVIGSETLGAQAEGIALYACADGSGLWITTAQDKARTVFHLFDRTDLSHRTAFTGAAVANTDGIWLQQEASARFPDGVLYAVHDDQGVVAIDWRDIAAATGVARNCAISNN